MSPTIAIVIPTRNRFHHLCRALRSVRNNVCPELKEVVIVNNNDRPFTEEEIAQLPLERDLFRIVECEARGQGPARNTGIAYSRADWVLFLDDDCELAPGFLETLVKSIQDHPSLRIFSAFPHNPYPENIYTRVWEAMFRYHYLSAPPKESSYRTPLLLGNCYCIHRTVFDQVGVFDPQLSPREDYDFVIRLRGAKVDVNVFPELKVYHYTRTRFWEVFHQSLGYARAQHAVDAKWGAHQLPPVNYADAVQTVQHLTGLSRTRLFWPLFARSWGKTVGLAAPRSLTLREWVRCTRQAARDVREVLRLCSSPA